MHKEKIEMASSRKHAVNYLEMCVNSSKAQRELMDKIPVLSTVNLTDPSKAPKEIVSEVFESF